MREKTGPILSFGLRMLLKIACPQQQPAIPGAAIHKPTQQARLYIHALLSVPRSLVAQHFHYDIGINYIFSLFFYFVCFSNFRVHCTPIRTLEKQKNCSPRSRCTVV